MAQTKGKSLRNSSSNTMLKHPTPNQLAKNGEAAQAHILVFGGDNCSHFAAMSRSKVQKADDDVDPTQYFENRVKTLGALKSAGINPYPHKFHVSMSIPEYIENYEGLTNEECLEDVEVCLAGRIMNKRSCSTKLFFYDLHGNGAKVQVMARVQDKTNARVSELDKAEFSKLHSGVKRGDVVGVIGYPGLEFCWLL